MPVEIIADHEMLKRFRRWRPLQNPTPDFVFEKINRRHRQEKDVVQIGGDRRRHFIRSTDPRETNREQRFQTVERRESEKNSDCGAKGDGMRRVGHRHQRHVVIGQPFFLSFEPPRQRRSVAALVN